MENIITFLIIIFGIGNIFFSKHQLDIIYNEVNYNKTLTNNIHNNYQLNIHIIDSLITRV